MNAVSVVEEAGSVRGARLVALVLICAGVAMLEGFDILSISIAAPALTKELGFHAGQVGEIFASGQAGLVIGAMLGGAAGDRFGRRNVMAVGVACFGLFGLATIPAGSLAILTLVRALTGLGIGIAMPNLIAITVEAAPARRRGTVVSFVLAGVSVGGIIVALLGASFLKAWGWRSLFYIGGLAPLVLLPTLFWLKDIRRHRPAHGLISSVQWLDCLFSEGRAKITVLLWGSLFLTAAVLYMVVTWLPSLMSDRGYDPQISHLSSALFSGGSAVGAVCAGVLIDTFGYAAIVPAFYPGVLLGLVCVLFGQHSSLVLSGAFLLGTCIGGAFYSLNGLSPQLYPEQARGLGAGAAVGLGRIGSILGPLGAGFLLQSGAGPFPPGPSAIPPVALSLTVCAFVFVVMLTRRHGRSIVARSSLA
jgi:AAHS family 3-hydroxyphenylpropionic acid transporter